MTEVRYPARRVGSREELERPGDYARVGDRVWFVLPIADPDDPLRWVDYDQARSPEENRAAWADNRVNGVHMVSQPPWVFRECDDGSLEVRESIACGDHDPEGRYFHGFLDEGDVWRRLPT